MMRIDETPITTRAIVPGEPNARWGNGKFRPRFMIDEKDRAFEILDLREVERRLKAREVEDEARVSV